MKTTEHNGIKIFFNTNNHSYIDSNGLEYTSVTRLIDKAFPEFDQLNAAKEKSYRTGIPYSKLLQEWQELSESSIEDGKRLHEIAENVIMDNKNYVPVSRFENLLYQNIKSTVSSLRKHYFLESEKIIFSPKFRIAGTIDIFAKNEGKYAVYDWKRIKKLYTSSTEFGCIPPTQELFNCNYIHYSLQTSLYAEILKQEEYIPGNSSVNKYLLIRDRLSGSFNTVICEDLEQTARKLLYWNMENRERL